MISWLFGRQKDQADRIDAAEQLAKSARKDREAAMAALRDALRNEKTSKINDGLKSLISEAPD